MADRGEAWPESPLHLLTAAGNGVFGPEQQFGEAGALADVAFAIAPSGDLQVAYLIRQFAGHEGPTALYVSHGPVGMPLPTPVALASGGEGTSLGSPVAVGFSQGETATLVWAKPGAEDETGGTLEVFTRPATGTFAGPQKIATGAEGLALANGPGASAVLAWMHWTRAGPHRTWTVRAVLRPTPGGSFSRDETISDTSRNALWPSVAMTPHGDAIATWLTDTGGASSGQVAAAIHPSD